LQINEWIGGMEDTLAEDIVISWVQYG